MYLHVRVHSIWNIPGKKISCLFPNCPICSSPRETMSDGGDTAALSDKPSVKVILQVLFRPFCPPWLTQHVELYSDRHTHYSSRHTCAYAHACVHGHAASCTFSLPSTHSERIFFEPQVLLVYSALPTRRMEMMGQIIFNSLFDGFEIHYMTCHRWYSKQWSWRWD